MTTPNLCQFWDCDEIIPWDHFLCYDHYTGYQGDMIDQCPACGQYKDAEYDVCLVCYQQPAAAPRGFARPHARIAEPKARYYQADAAMPVNANYAALLGELHDLRRSMAGMDGLREFMVFSNDTLEQLAQMRPTTERAMLEISGIGPAKMARYGADVLRVIRRHTNRSQTPAQTAGVRVGGQTDGVASRPQTPVQVAGPLADDPRKRWPARYRTIDGHYVRSRAEWMIDVWLSHHGIAHAYERKLPIAENAIPDFYLPQGNVYIEFWGKEDEADYARRMREKQEIYRRNGLRLISLTDAEMYSLDDHMPRLLRDYGIGIV